MWRSLWPGAWACEECVDTAGGKGGPHSRIESKRAELTLLTTGADAKAEQREGNKKVAACGGSMITP